jgi:hypothetical protein
MSEPFGSRGRTDEPWERGLYLLLLIVAVVVILYSLYGIATLLGYLPLSQIGGGGRPMQYPAVEGKRLPDRIKHGPLLTEADSDRIAVRNGPATYRSTRNGSGYEGAAK